MTTSHPHSLSAPSTHPTVRVKMVAKRVAISVIAFWRARRNRREVTELLRLDDRMLRDIGLVRSDVLGALAEPAGADPSVGLRLRSVENRVRQRERAAQVDRLTARRAARPIVDLTARKAA